MVHGFALTLPTFATAMRQRTVCPGTNGPAVSGEQEVPHAPMKNFDARIFGRSESTGLVCNAVIVASPVACAVTVLTMFCPNATGVNGEA